MTRFIQQKIRNMIGRFIPPAWCPSCGKKQLPPVAQKVENSLSEPQIRKKTTKTTSKKKKI